MWVLVFLSRLTAEDATASDKGQLFAELAVKGSECEGRKDYAGAFENYSKALAAKADSATILIRRAYVAAKLGQNERAAHDLKDGVKVTPVSITDYLTVAWLRSTSPFESMRDGTEAVALAQRALKEQPSAEAYDMLAAGYAEMKNFGKAQENIRTAIKLFPDSPRLTSMQERLELYKSHKPWREIWGVETEKMDRALVNP